MVLTAGSMGGAVLEAVRAARPAIDRLAARALLVGRRAVGARGRRRTQRPAVARSAARRPRPARGEHPPVRGVRSRPSLDDAAYAYAAELARFGAEGLPHPVFDIVFSGVGPDGHIGLLAVPAPFGHPGRRPPGDRGAGVAEAAARAAQPHASRAQRVAARMAGAAGADKASALGLALAGASRDEVPVAGIKAGGARCSSSIGMPRRRSPTRSSRATTEHVRRDEGPPRSGRPFVSRRSVLRRGADVHGAAGALSRSAAASSSVRRSFTYARCVLYGSSYGRRAVPVAPAGRPVDGLSTSGISSSGGSPRRAPGLSRRLRASQ